MSSAKRYKGLTVNRGTAIGEAVFLVDNALTVVRPMTPKQAASRLHDAIAATRLKLQRQAEAADETGAAILEFQIEMLGDPALCEDVWPALAQGTPLVEAWNSVMAEQITPFDEDDDPYFRARAADLRDIRDGVLFALNQSSGQANLAGKIVIAGDVGPSRFLALVDDGIAGLVLIDGNPASHVAILARARDVPLVMGTGPIARCTHMAIDAAQGLAFADPDEQTRRDLHNRQAMAQQAHAAGLELLRKPAKLLTGERVFTYLNIDDPQAIDLGMIKLADGIGLWRTEFQFIGRESLPDEDEQYEVMAGICRMLEGKSLVVRSIDIGGDKPLPFLDLPHESNPFLGLRGLRLCLAYPDLWRGQIRAVLRLAADYPVKLMLPMVTRPVELEKARRFIEDVKDTLKRAAMPELGVMIETPASAIACDLFDADFFSIGSNDLTQYVMAASRDASGPVAELADPLDPAVMRLIGGGD